MVSQMNIGTTNSEMTEYSLCRNDLHKLLKTGVYEIDIFIFFAHEQITSDT